MTKLTRLTAKIFGETATATGADPEIGQFGSALAGTYVGTTDVATIQSLPAWSNGFIDSVTPSTQFPPLPEMTGFGKVLSYQNAYTLQQGVPEWDNATVYYINNFCSYEGIIYKSLTDSNLNNNPSTDTINWIRYLSDDYANQDLSNLTTSGKEKVITLAHELDWNNAILVDSNYTPTQTSIPYTMPDDGVLLVYTKSEGGSNVKTVNAIIYFTSDLNGPQVSGSMYTSGGAYTGVYFPFLKGTTAYYHFNITGTATTRVGRCYFVPFKKEV